MSRHLLLSAMLFLSATAAWSQAGTFDDPIPIVAGENSAEYNTSTGEDVVFSYTATEGTKLTITRPSSMYHSLYATADETTPISGGYNYENVGGTYYYTYVYPVAAGQTIYLAASDNTGSVAFTAEMEACATAGQGVVSADDPITIKAGDSFFIGDGYTNRVSYSYHTYATYTAEETGVLVFSANAGATVAVNGATSGTSFTTDYSTNLRTYNLSVTEGETYTLHFWSSYATFVTSEMTHPQPGSLVNPFTITGDGEYTVPAAAGKYYYYYKPDKTGFITISSDNALPEGQVVLYTSRSYVGSYSNAESEVGSYYLRYEISYVYASSEYYIEVNKVQATDADETFTFAYSDYALGEKESNPIVIEAEGTDITTGNGEPTMGITTYYAYTVPGEGSKMMNVVATSTISNENTLLRINPQNSYWSVVGQGNTAASGTVEGGSTYTIRVSNFEEGPITFRVSTSEIAAGDIITNPLTAVLGENTLPGDGIKYYQYTATMDGKLTVTVANGMTASFPMNTSQYTSYYTTAQDGNSYTITITAGTTYYITLSGCVSGNTFTVAERDFVQGESRDNPLVMENGTFDLGNSLVGDVWLQYTCASSGLLKISTDLVGNYSSNHVIEWGPATGTMSSIANYNYSDGTISYSGQSVVSEGDVYLVHLQLDSTCPGNTLTLSLGELDPGMSLSTAIELTNGVAQQLSNASSALPIWYKVNLGAGSATARVTSSSSYGASYPYVYMFTSEADAEAGTNSTPINWDYEYDSWGLYVIGYSTTFEVAESGYIYLRFDQSSSTDSITVSGEQAAPVVTGNGTYADPYTLISGTNTATIEQATTGSTVSAVFAYTASEGTALNIATAAGTSLTVRYARAEGDTVSVSGGYVSGSTYAYPVAAGMTVYVVASSTSGTVTFDASMESVPTAGTGKTADAPLTITPGEKFFLGDGYSQVNYSYDTYATFTATESGVLQFNATNYASVAVNGGSPVYFNYSANGYSYLLTVNQGETYNMAFNSYGVVLVTPEMTHPEPGSLNMPFEITGDGQYTVPAEMGVYYYRYQPTAEGYCSITSEEALAGGQVLVFNSNRYIDYGADYAAAISEVGSFDTRFEVTYTGYTYWIQVNKEETTSAEQTFTFTYEGYAAGTQESNPIVIESLPAEFTTDNSNTYYSYTVPEGESMILDVIATSTITSEYTTFYIYPQGNNWSLVGSGNNGASGAVDGGQTYTIHVASDESAPITFTVSTRPIEQGDVITNPLQAVSGRNDITGEGTKYYTYTATLSGKMTVSVSEPTMSVAFPMGTDQWSGNHNAVVSGTDYTIDVEAGTTYYIAVSGCAEGTYFTISEREYMVGEGEDNPIIVENDSYTITEDQSGSLWFKWTSPTDGVLTISFSAPYNWENYAYYGHPGDEYLDYMVTSSGYDQAYSVTVPTTAGEEWIVNLELNVPCPNETLTFSVRDLEAGESVDNAILLQVGETNTLLGGTRNMPRWYMVSLGVGEMTMTANEYISAIWYNSKEEALVGSEDNYIYWNYDYTPDYSSYTCSYTSNIAEEGVYYIAVLNGSGSSTLLIDGVPGPEISTGIAGVNEANGSLTAGKGSLSINGQGNVAIYSMSGACVANGMVKGNHTFNLAAGVYIVKVNGVATKVVVK